MVFHSLLNHFTGLEAVFHLHLFTMLYIFFIMCSGSYGLLWNPFLSLLYLLIKVGWFLLLFSWSSLYIHFGARLYYSSLSGEFLIIAPVLSILNCALLAWCLPKYRVIANGMEEFILSRRQQRIGDVLNQPAPAA